MWRSTVALTGFLTLTVLWAQDGPAAAPSATRSAVDPAAVELFEKEIRPLLVTRCQSCHGEKKSQGGLRLTSRAGMVQGGVGGAAIVPGKPEQSLLIKAVEYHSVLKMPPDGKLSAPQIERLKRWIALGAPWPATSQAAARQAAHRRWWAFQRPRVAVPPAGAATSPIDHFVRAELKAHGLSPAVRADRRTLIRRVTLDLTGLPPTPEEVAEFERECELERGQGPGAGGRGPGGQGENAPRTPTPSSPNPGSRPVAPGARQGSGFRVPDEAVGSRPSAPSPAPGPRPLAPSPSSRHPTPGAYSRLVDRLLASPAYGERFGRHWLDVVRYADYHDGNPQARTASCEPLMAWRYRDWVVGALNRDMPFDQFITHQIAGDTLPSPDGQELYPDGLIASTFLTNGSWDRGDADKEKMVSDMVDDQVDTVGKAFLGLTLGCARCHDHKFDPVTQSDYYALAGIFYSTRILADIGAKGGEYTVNRIPLVPKAYLEKRDQQLQQLRMLEGQFAALEMRVPKPPADDPERLKLIGRRDGLQKELLPEPPLAEAAQEGGTAKGLFPGIQDVPIHIRGSYTRLGDVVPRRMPTFFAGSAQPAIKSGSGRRELAAWVASKDNPLTARVIVNRAWQWHFGTGLVRTPNNFGMLSEAPSHPALLDWLAARFVEDGWSLKKLHRRIVLSDTYQQSSVVPRAAVTRDPDNRWLGRFTARRLEAEAIRDSMLSVSGKLDRTPGGPAAADVSKPCRSLYVQTARWDRSGFSTLFDAANPDASEEKRNVSTVAPQALFLLNHEFTLDQAKQLAQRIIREHRGDDLVRIRRVYELLYSRPPTSEEVRLCQSYFSKAGKRVLDETWVDLTHVLLCSNEFVYMD